MILTNFSNEYLVVCLYSSITNTKYFLSLPLVNYEDNSITAPRIGDLQRYPADKMLELLTALLDVHNKYVLMHYTIIVYSYSNKDIKNSPEGFIVDVESLTPYKTFHSPKEAIEYIESEIGVSNDSNE